MKVGYINARRDEWGYLHDLWFEGSPPYMIGDKAMRPWVKRVFIGLGRDWRRHGEYVVPRTPTGYLAGAFLWVYLRALRIYRELEFINRDLGTRSIYGN